MLLDAPNTTPKPNSAAVRNLEALLADLISTGGPRPHEYSQLNRAIRQLGDEVRAGLIHSQSLVPHIRTFSMQHFPGTMQMASLTKKYGYSGDFEMIDDIYRMKTAPAAHLRRWDLFFHGQAAPVAVRNRKTYFHHILRKLCAERGSQSEPLRVLNVASGPARDLREWFDSDPPAEVVFDCVEMDANAIEFATRLCNRHLEFITFHQKNALRHIPATGYDLVWSAGLFDYLSDRVFVRLLKSLIPVVRPGGEVVVGNFSDYNPSRDYMELMGDWFLEHRSEEKLQELARKAGASDGAISVEWEPAGVNLFLHVQP